MQGTYKSKKEEKIRDRGALRSQLPDTGRKITEEQKNLPVLKKSLSIHFRRICLTKWRARKTIIKIPTKVQQNFKYKMNILNYPERIKNYNTGTISLTSSFSFEIRDARG